LAHSRKIRHRPGGRHVQQGALVPEGHVLVRGGARVRWGNASPATPREAAEERLRVTRRVPHFRGIRASEGEFSRTS
jgi:hypothetical protein